MHLFFHSLHNMNTVIYLYCDIEYDIYCGENTVVKGESIFLKLCGKMFSAVIRFNSRYFIMRSTKA